MKARKVDYLLNRFKRKLFKRINKNEIFGMYLFGSYSKNCATKYSDIDVLVIVSDKCKMTEIGDKVDEVCFDIACECGDAPEVLLMDKIEFKRGLGTSPLLWEIVNYGKALFIKEKMTEWELEYKGYLRLAEEYLKAAKYVFKGKLLRLAIDAGYNAAELIAKCLIISTKTSLASTHSGIIGQFGKLFVLTKKVEPEIGRGLRKALRLRALARYKPEAKITKQNADFVINLAEKLLIYAKKELI
jgi:uncharacterized protein (UPF0332 family)